METDLIPLEKIIDIQNRLTEANFDLTAFMDMIVNEVQALTPATGAVVELVEGDDMVYKAASGTVADHVGLHLPRKTSISGLCVAEKNILIAEDTETDPRVNREACRKVGARSLVVTPLFHQGEAVGVIKVLSREAKAFREKDVQILQLMARFLGAGLAHQLSYKDSQDKLVAAKKALGKANADQDALRHRATHDVLTGLSNREFFHESLTKSLKDLATKKGLVALMYIDMDHFKTINDEHGHQVGDELLKTFAARLEQCVRASDFVGREGGDEFIILLTDLKNSEDAVAVAQKIIQKMAAPFVLEKIKLQVTTSIGIAFATDSTYCPDRLISEADKALYEAKKHGRNQYQVFS